MKTVFLFFILFFSTKIYSQTGQIQGHITESQNNFDLGEVIVQLQDNKTSTISNSSGLYQLKQVKYGTYYVVFSKKGYYSLVIPDVKIKNSKPIILDIEMVPGNEKEYLFLEIGGIQVTANRELLSEEPETVHRISSGEIEHMQANSLANVLSLIPGNVQDSPPGLQKKQDISLRGFNETGELFGTQVIVDDIPLSNNANLQTGVGVNYGSKVQSTVNTQYDLREVVAENLEKVEVLSGATSVEYGDHSQGLILAKTKVNNVPTRFRIRNNPDTREANLMGSFYTFNTNFIYNLNYGFSERDIRVSGDEYHRIAGDFKMKNAFTDIGLDLLQIFKYGRKIEEDDDDSDPEGTKAYNRDYYLTYSHQLDYKWDDLTDVYIRNFINFRRRNSWKRRLETPDLAIWTDRMTAGTREGIIPESATYYSEVKTIGHEWTYGSKLKVERKLLFGNTLHRLLMGVEFQTDDNTGPGKNYDLLKPPGGIKSRPRSFDDVPGTVQLSLFANNRITGKLIFPYTLNLGFRIESYNPTGVDFGNLFKNRDIFSAKQGTFFNPRIGLKLKVLPKSQLRFTYSKSSKVPPINSIYPPIFYLDVYDQTYKIVNDSVKYIDLVSTYTYNQAALNLKGYQSTKYEASVDYKIGNFGLSLTGYYQQTKGIHKDIYIPFSYNRYFWVDWPDTTNRLILESVLTKDSKYQIAKNLGKSVSSGIEFSLVSHRISPLNMKFNINGSFNFTKYSSEYYPRYGSTEFFSVGDTLPSGNIAEEETQIMPFYEPTGRWRQRTVINYHIDYIANSLGIWLTFKAQQVLWNQDLDVYDPKPHAIGYYQNGQVYSITKEISDRMGFTGSYDELDITTDKSKPNDQWMFGVTVSKSLFKGAEVSLYVENIFNDRAYYLNRQGMYSARNHEIFWGISFSSKVDELFN